MLGSMSAAELPTEIPEWYPILDAAADVPSMMLVETSEESRRLIVGELFQIVLHWA